MNKKIVLLILLIASGINSSFLYKDYSDFLGDTTLDFFTINYAGLIFGIAIGVYYFIYKKTSMVKVLPFIAGSTIGYFAAVYNAINPILESVINYNEYFNFIFAGSIGTFILSLSKNLFLTKPNIWEVISVTLVGGLTSIVFVHVSTPIIAITIWQVIVGSSVVFFDSSNKINEQYS